MGQGDLAGDGQAQPGPLGLGREEWLEEVLPAPRASVPGRYPPRWPGSRAATASRRVVRRSVPPGGMAWTALVVRLRKICKQGRRGHRHRRQIGIELDLDPDSLGLGRPRRPSRAASATTALRSPGARSWASARENWSSRVTISSQAVDFMDQAVERLGVEPDPALPELGRRADAGQRVADLMGDARQQLAQGREPLAAPQLGLEPVALGRLPADGARQPRGERERQRDSSQSQARGQLVTLELSGRRTADRPVGSSPSVAPDDATVDDHRGRADRHGDRVDVSQLLDHKLHLLLANRSVHLNVDQVASSGGKLDWSGPSTD